MKAKYQPPPLGQAKAFVSYSRKDLRFVEQLAAALEARGCDVFLDRKDILPAEPWRNRLSQLVLEADSVIFVITEHSIASEVCAWELSEAERLAKRLLPVVRETVDASRIPALARLNFLFMRAQDNFKLALDSLVTALNTDIKWVREHTRLGMLADGWNSRGRPPSEILRADALAAAEQWLQLTSALATQPTNLQREYIAESRRRYELEEKEKKTVMDGYMVSQSRFLAELANRQTNLGDAVTGALLALEGLPQEGDLVARPYVAAAEFALINAYYRIREDKVLPFEAAIADVALHPDQDTLAVALRDSSIEIKAIASGATKVRLRQHKKEVNSVRFSSSGTRLLSASDDDTCIVWAFPSMLPMAVLKGGEGCDLAVISADEKAILTKYGAAIVSWDADTFRQIAQWQAAAGSTYGFDVMPDGRFAVTGSGRFAMDLFERKYVGENVARVWDVRQGRMAAELTGFEGGVLSVAFDPVDGSRILIASADKTARVWHWSGRRRPLVLKKHAGRVLNCAWSADGKQVITASEDHTACIWTGKGELVTTLSGHEQAVTAAGFMPDGKHAFTASRDGTAGLWDCASGMQTLQLRGHEDAVTKMTVLAGGRRALTASADSTARIWNIDELANGSAWKWEDSDSLADQLIFSPDSRRLLVTTDSAVYLRNLETERTDLEIRREGPGSDQCAVMFAASGESFLLRLDDQVAVYSVAVLAKLFTIRHGKKDVEEACFSPGGQQILTASGDSAVRLWDAHDGRLVGKLAAGKGKRAAVESASFSADGNHIVGFDEAGDKALIWSVASQRLAAAIGDKKRRIEVAVFHPSTPVCVTGGRSGVHVWTLDGKWDREMGPSRLGMSDVIRALKFSPNGKYLLAKSSWDDDEKLSFWDFESGSYLGQIGGADLGSEIRLFSPDSDKFLTTFYAQIPLYGSLSTSRATLWTLPSLERRALLAEAGDVVSAAAFDHRSRFLATGHEDGTVRLWDASSGESVATLTGHGSSVQAVTFSPDGRLLASIGYHDLITRRVFDSTQSAIDELKKVLPRALTLEQRKRFFLSDTPPDWCIESAKWPFHSEEWKRRLESKQAQTYL